VKKKRREKNSQDQKKLVKVIENRKTKKNEKATFQCDSSSVFSRALRKARGAFGSVKGHKRPRTRRYSHQEHEQAEAMRQGPRSER